MELIIKIDDDIAKGIRGENDCEVEPREIVRSFQATIAEAIKNATPYNPSGDCISREALKGVIETYRPALIYNNKTDMKNRMVDYFLDEIDNAQAVCGNDPRWCERCVPKGKCASTRTQGHWIRQDNTKFFCSECGRVIDTTPFTRPDNFPFCHCGADMRPKGGDPDEENS